MNEEHDGTHQAAEQWSAFQQIWGETFSKMFQLGFTLSPDSPPPEFMRQMRSGVFQALGKSWEHFLRSPQFMEGMKQHMDVTLALRKMSGDLFSKLRHETQSTTRDDIDAVMLAVRHMETRVLDRVERLAAKIENIESQSNGTKKKIPAPSKPKRKQAARATPPKAKTAPPVAKRKAGSAKKSTPRKK